LEGALDTGVDTSY
jgi:hypothetical protein